MNVRVLLAAVAALVVGGAVLLLWPKKHQTPEEQVRALVAQSVAAAEKKAVGDITEAIAEDFKGPSGARKQDVKAVLLGQLLRNPDGVLVLNPTLEVSMESDQAATFNGVFVFARPGQDWQAPGSGVSRYDIAGRVELRDGQWMYVSAQWHRP